MAITVGRFNAQIKQEPEEFQALAEEIEKINPQIIIEIGVLRGGIIAYYRKRGLQVIGIDVGNHPTGLKEFPPDVVIGNSHSEATLAEVIRRLNNEKADVLFIDGDHSYRGCKQDFEMYAPLVRKGGIIAFHDILRGGWHEEALKKHAKEIKVGKIWNELKRTNEYKWKEIVCGNTWAGIGVLYV
jgi:predicted O-methyltransferase YrrM